MCFSSLEVIESHVVDHEIPTNKNNLMSSESVFPDSSLCFSSTAAVAAVSDIAEQASDSLKHGVGVVGRS